MNLLSNLSDMVSKISAEWHGKSTASTTPANVACYWCIRALGQHIWHLELVDRARLKCRCLCSEHSIGSLDCILQVCDDGAFQRPMSAAIGFNGCLHPSQMVSIEKHCIVSNLSDGTQKNDEENLMWWSLLLLYLHVATTSRKQARKQGGRRIELRPPTSRIMRCLSFRLRASVLGRFTDNGMSNPRPFSCSCQGLQALHARHRPTAPLSLLRRAQAPPSSTTPTNAAENEIWDLFTLLQKKKNLPNFNNVKILTGFLI